MNWTDQQLLAGTWVAGMALLGCAVHNGSASNPPSEAMLAVPKASELAYVELSTDQEIPDEVREDIRRFGAALDTLGIEPFWISLDISPDGQAVLAYDRRQTTAPRAGVWLWSSWRNPDNVVHYPGCWSARFAGPDHVRCGDTLIAVHENRQLEMPERALGKVVMDVRVDDAGEWWALVTKDGLLLMGALDEAGETLQPLHSKFLHYEARHRSMDFVGASRFFVLNREDTLLAIDPASGEAVIIGEYGQGRPMRAGSGGIVFDKRMILFGDEVSDFQPHWLGLKRKEYVISVSPSGKFLYTSSSLFDYFYNIHVRRTPLAGPSEPLPAPHHLSEGWIAWD